MILGFTWALLRREPQIYWHKNVSLLVWNVQSLSKQHIFNGILISSFIASEICESIKMKLVINDYSPCERSV